MSLLGADVVVIVVGLVATTTQAILMRRTLTKFAVVPPLPRIQMIVGWFTAILAPWVAVLIAPSARMAFVAIVFSTCFSLVVYCGWLGGLWLRERFIR